MAKEIVPVILAAGRGRRQQQVDLYDSLRRDSGALRSEVVHQSRRGYRRRAGPQPDDDAADPHSGLYRQPVGGRSD